MKSKIRIPVVIAIVLLMVLTGTVLAQATVIHTRIDDTVDWEEYVPCAADGAGEWIQLSGDLHVFMHITVDSNGGVLFNDQFNPQGVIGVGETTGDVYRATGVYHSTYTGKIGETVTEIDNYRMIGPGPDNNLLVHGVFHVTVDADGDVVAFVDQYSMECK